MNLHNWTYLKRINSSKFINSMYMWIFLVPIFVKLFEFIEGKYSFIIFAQTIEINFSLPFSLILFYFSALFFAIANLLYMFKCPLIIKDHNSFSDFENEKKDFLHINKYLYDLNLIEETVRDQIAKRIRKEESTSLDMASRSIDNNKLRNYFWQINENAINSRKISYFSTLTLYLLGFILFVIVLGQNFINVIQLMLS